VECYRGSAASGVYSIKSFNTKLQTYFDIARQNAWVRCREEFNEIYM